jgi:hypothetical protein
VDVDWKLTPEGRIWMVNCVNAYRENCVAIQAYNKEDVKKCDITPRSQPPSR